MLTATIRDDNGKALGIIVLSEKTFASGSTGYFGSTKIEIDAQRFQLQAQAVRIGSKPSTEPEK